MSSKGTSGVSEHGCVGVREKGALMQLKGLEGRGRAWVGVGVGQRVIATRG